MSVYGFLDTSPDKIEEFCGARPPLQVMSAGPRLRLVLKGRDPGRDARGFNVTYRFVESEYRYFSR